MFSVSASGIFVRRSENATFGQGIRFDRRVHYAKSVQGKSLDKSQEFINSAMTNKGHELYEFGPFLLDPVKRILLRDSRPVPLPLKVLETLLVLVRNGEQVVLKEELMKAVWPDTFVEEGNLAQSIFVLRKTLGSLNGEQRLIETIPGRGYRLALKAQTV